MIISLRPNIFNVILQFHSVSDKTKLKMGSGRKDGCTSCITRTPYATLIALIMCWAGVGVFCGTMYRGVNLTLRLLQNVFKLDRGLQWLVRMVSKIEI